MSAPEIAILSYHGWEIDPARLADDVQALRARGWCDLSLADLQSRLAARSSDAGRRFFHVTIDDGAQGDRECVAALGSVSCPVTLFLSLDIMSAEAHAIHQQLGASADVALEDHSLRHARIFHFRHVIGFHSDQNPLLTSPERLGLQAGDPVCAYGGELARRRFTPDPRAIEACRAAAGQIAAPPGSAKWTAELADRLIARGLGYRRLGKLCVAGAYEPQQSFCERIGTSLEEGRQRLARFTGRSPIAFAHPWWEPSRVAEARLRALGYEMTFAGRGLCRRAGRFNVPRLFVSNETARPIDPNRLAAADRSSAVRSWALDVSRRAVFA